MAENNLNHPTGVSQNGLTGAGSSDSAVGDGVLHTSPLFSAVTAQSNRQEERNLLPLSQRYAAIESNGPRRIGRMSFFVEDMDTGEAEPVDIVPVLLGQVPRIVDLSWVSPGRMSARLPFVTDSLFPPNPQLIGATFTPAPEMHLETIPLERFGRALFFLQLYGFNEYHDPEAYGFVDLHASSWDCAFMGCDHRCSSSGEHGLVLFCKAIGTPGPALPNYAWDSRVFGCRCGSFDEHAIRVRNFYRFALRTILFSRDTPPLTKRRCIVHMQNGEIVQSKDKHVSSFIKDYLMEFTSLEMPSELSEYIPWLPIISGIVLASTWNDVFLMVSVHFKDSWADFMSWLRCVGSWAARPQISTSEIKGFLEFAISSEVSMVFGILTFFVSKLFFGESLKLPETMDWLKGFSFDKSSMYSMLKSVVNFAESAIDGRLAKAISERTFSVFLGGAAREANAARQYIATCAPRTDVLSAKFAEGVNLLPISVYRSELKAHRDTLTKRLNGKDAPAVVGALKEVTTELSRVSSDTCPRYTPFVVGICGKCGIGKTSVITAITKSLLSFWKVPGKPEDNVIAISENATYVEHYANQVFAHFDDLSLPSGTSSEKTIIDEFLRMASADPHIINGAAIENKRNFFTSPFITMTSNFDMFGFERRFGNYQAALRRIVRIEVTLKVEHENQRGKLEPGDSVGDYWNYRFLDHMDDPASMCLSLNEMLVYLRYLSVVHFHNQRVMKEYSSENLCNCGVPIAQQAVNLPDAECIPGAHSPDSLPAGATYIKPKLYVDLEHSLTYLSEVMDAFRGVYGGEVPSSGALENQSFGAYGPWIVQEVFRANIMAGCSFAWWLGGTYGYLYLSRTGKNIRDYFTKVFKLCDNISNAKVSDVLGVVSPLRVLRLFDPRPVFSEPLSAAYGNWIGLAACSAFSVVAVRSLQAFLRSWSKQIEVQGPNVTRVSSLKQAVSEPPPASYASKGLRIPAYSIGVSRTFTKESLLSFASQEIYAMNVFYADGNSTDGFCFSMSCVDVMLPAHYFYAGPGPWTVELTQPWRQSNFKIVHTFNESELALRPDDITYCDFCAVKIPIGQSQGLSRFLVKGSGFDWDSLTRMVALDLKRSSREELVMVELEFVGTCISGQPKSKSYTFPPGTPLIVYKGLWGPGYCGTPIFAQFGAKDWVLVGYHSAGTSGEEEDPEGFASIMPPVQFPRSDFIPQLGVGPLSKRSFLNHLVDMDETPVQVIGSAGNHIPRATTVFQESGLVPEDIGLVPMECDGASFDGEWRFAPLYNLKRRAVGNNMDISPAVEALVGLLENDGLVAPEYNLLSLHEAVNGFGNLKPLDMTTSGGFLFNGEKGRYFERHIDEDGVTWYPDQSVRDAVDRVLDRYREGNHYRPVFSTFIKDELVKPAKNEKRSHRIIYSSPLEWTIVVRMYLGSIFSWILSDPLRFHMAVGLNPLSEDWARILDHLRAVDDELKHLVAGDYSGFDVNALQKHILAVGQFFLAMARKMRAPESAQVIIWLIFEDLSAIVACYGADVFCPNGGNPSGWPGTIFLNCVLNLLFHLLTIIDQMRRGQKFIGFRAVTMGDDVVAVSPGCLDQILHERMGHKHSFVYTTASKEQVSERFTPFSQLTFLKRSFEERDGIIWAPLERTSILKTLKYYRESKVLSREESIKTNCHNALLEAFVHGEEFHSEIARICGENYTEQYSYAQLLEDFNEGVIFKKWVRTL